MGNIQKYLQDSYSRFPMNDLVYSKGRYWTYKEIYSASRSFSKILKEHGVSEKDNVVLYIDNSAEYIIAYFALLFLGAVVVPINVSMNVENIQYILEDSQAKCLISTKFKSAYLNKHIDLNGILMIEIDKIAFDLDILDFNTKDFDDDNTALILYTSGTTAKPKGVMLSHKNLDANTSSILDYLKLNDKDSLLVTLSFGYSYGNSLLLTHVKAGGFLYISQDTMFPQNILKTLEANNFSGFSTVGSYLNILLKQDNISDKPFLNLKYMTFAGESTSFNDLKALLDLNLNLKLYVMYGQTEASARLTYLEPDMLFLKKGSCGKAIKGVDIRIVDDLGRDVVLGMTGEIVAKGDNIMKGYLNDIDSTEEKIKDGWLYTGDLAYQDEDGYIYIVGRKNDLIKYLGHRISPIEIENKINKCENILESAVVEWHKDVDDVKIKAYVVLKDETRGILNLNEDLKQVLPPFKRPHIIEVIREIPKTFNGKIKRALLKDSDL